MAKIKRVSDEGHLLDTEVALYVQALLEDDLLQVGEMDLRHVEACSKCKERILDVYLSLADREPLAAHRHRHEPAHPTSLGQRRRRLNLPLIAAVLVGCVVLLGLYRLLLQSPDVQPVPIRQPKDKTVARNSEPLPPVPIRKVEAQKANSHKSGKMIQPSSSKRVSLRFRLNANLEAMINSPTRSAVWEILSPANDYVYDHPFFFRWKRASPLALKLKILSNTNRVIYTFAVTGREFLFNKPLSPGLYYWKLESSQDLLHVGRFRVTQRLTAPAR